MKEPNLESFFPKELETPNKCKGSLILLESRCLTWHIHLHPPTSACHPFTVEHLGHPNRDANYIIVVGLRLSTSLVFPCGNLYGAYGGHFELFNHLIFARSWQSVEGSNIFGRLIAFSTLVFKKKIALILNEPSFHACSRETCPKRLGVVPKNERTSHPICTYGLAKYLL